jgi:hypothetical protein
VVAGESSPTLVVSLPEVLVSVLGATETSDVPELAPPSSLVQARANTLRTKTKTPRHRMVRAFTPEV